MRFSAPALLTLLVLAPGATANSPSPSHLSVSAIASEPTQKVRPTPQEVQQLSNAVQVNPRLRDPHFALTRGLMAAGDLAGAHLAAQAWRAHDAYNLVVVRLLGDIETEQGKALAARRTYSSIVELLPSDPQARRALATVLKQGGDLEGARQQLLAALTLGKDRHAEFELGDVEYRLGLAAARERFLAIANAPEVPESIRYPAKQRLAQIAAKRRRDALAAGDQAQAKLATDELAALEIAGGTENDLKVFLSWDTDRTDVDLWVTTPSGEKVFYSHREGAGGEKLFDDVTTGYGPESFTARRAALGTYAVTVHYYSARPGAFKEARGEVQVILNEGRANETRQTFPYRLFEQNDSVIVAKVQVAAATGGV